MRLEPSDLQAIADAVIERINAHQAASNQLNGQLAYSEAEAAALLGLPKTSLREARMRGDITARRSGKRVIYSRAELMRYAEGDR